MTESKENIMTPSRDYPQAPVVGVGAVVIDGGRVLLVRRGREPLLGQWSLPGGAVELGETLEAAIVREVEEETGISVDLIGIVKTLDRIERDADGRVRFHYVLVDFLCRAISAEDEPRAASDVSEARWAPVESLRVREGADRMVDWTLGSN